LPPFGPVPVFVFPVQKYKAYKSALLSFVSYGCETWSLTLREDHRLRVFESRVLRKVSGSKREEVTGNRGKL
jgi:hypothetical protein